MMNRQQADAMRRENEARSRAEYQKTQASFAASNRAAEQRNRAAQQAASTSAHNERMAGYARAGESLRSSMSAKAGHSGDARRGTSSAGSSGGSNSKGVLAFVLLVIGAIVVFGHSGTGSRNANQPTTLPPIEDGTQLNGSPKPSAGIVAPLEPAPIPQPVASAPAPDTAGPPAPASAQPNATGTSPANTSTSNAGADEVPLFTRRYVPPSAEIHLQVHDRYPPVYPAIARQAHVSGTATVVVAVNPDGSIATVQPGAGNPMLMQAAVDAARRWRFDPYTANTDGTLPTMSINFEFNQP